MSKRVCLGKIANAHGVKGLVKILPFGEDPFLIEDLGPAYTGETGANTLRIVLKNPLGKYILASVDGCDSRESAEALRGTELYYDRDLLPEPDEGEIYYDDLIGLDVFEADQLLGSVKAVDNFGAGDLLEINATSGPSFYLPYSDDFILEVDLDSGRITAQGSDNFREI